MLDPRQIQGMGRMVDTLYQRDCEALLSEMVTVASAQQDSHLDTWHYQLGHASEQCVKNMAYKQLATGSNCQKKKSWFSVKPALQGRCSGNPSQLLEKFIQRGSYSYQASLKFASAFMMLVTLVVVGKLVVACYLQAEVLVACSIHVYHMHEICIKHQRDLQFPRDCIRFTVCRLPLIHPRNMI